LVELKFTAKNDTRRYDFTLILKFFLVAVFNILHTLYYGTCAVAIEQKAR